MTYHLGMLTRARRDQARYPHGRPRTRKAALAAPGTRIGSRPLDPRILGMGGQRARGWSTCRPGYQMRDLANLSGAGAPVPSPTERRLTAAPFQTLAEVPAAAERFANIDNTRTRLAYLGDLQNFCRFVGLATAAEFHLVTRAHVLAWRADLERRGLAGATICRKLAALASVYDHLLNSNAVTGGNTVHVAVSKALGGARHSTDPGTCTDGTHTARGHLPRFSGLSQHSKSLQSFWDIV